MPIHGYLLRTTLLSPQFTITATAHYIPLSHKPLLPISHPHLVCLFPSADGIALEGELVLSYDGPAVLVPYVGYHVQLRGPHLKLSLPVDDGGQGSAHQERPFGVTLEPTEGGRRGAGLKVNSHCLKHVWWSSFD